MVFVCGLVTSVCVLDTAMACSAAGYPTFLVKDACADRSLLRHETVIECLRKQQQLPLQKVLSTQRQSHRPPTIEILSSYRDLLQFTSTPAPSSSRSCNPEQKGSLLTYVGNHFL